MTPRVSVLMAVHNGEPYLRTAVGSILDQTFQDLEFIVVDDASTDATVEIVESFRDRRIRLLRNERNFGQVVSLNRGMREAHGEYVARIDADDVALPNRLAHQVAMLDADPSVGLVGAWMDVIDDGGRLIAKLDARLDDTVHFVFETLRMNVLIAHPAAMFRRLPVLDLGGYDERTGPAEDKDLWRRLLLAGYDARIVPERLVVYRLHDRQLSQVQATYQREVDGLSQDAFITALVPGIAPRRLRHLLAADRTFWREGESLQTTLASLDRVLVAASDRLLGGDDAAARRLERLVGEDVLRFARTLPWSGDGRALLAWGRARVAPNRRSAATARHAAALLVAPPLRALRDAGRTVSDATDRVPSLRALRRPMKRSRAARAVYAKLIGGR